MGNCVLYVYVDKCVVRIKPFLLIFANEFKLEATKIKPLSKSIHKSTGCIVGRQF